VRAPRLRASTRSSGEVASTRASHRHQPATTGLGEPHREAGQSLVEFSLILFPLFLILLAIIQFGFVFNSYVTMTNAARDGARLGTIYIYDGAFSKSQNDLARNDAIKDAVLASMSMLGKTAPQFANDGTWSQSGTTSAPVFTQGDLVISYELNGQLDTDPRTGQRITVKGTYHEDLIVPIISNFLPKDSGGRLALTGVVTMVIN
jgi:Flp pilus assembly protein TadG